MKASYDEKTRADAHHQPEIVIEHAGANAHARTHTKTHGGSMRDGEGSAICVHLSVEGAAGVSKHLSFTYVM